MADLHGKIMNLQLDPGYEGPHVPHMKLGHKEARHAAAELAAGYDSRISELEAERDRLREALIDEFSENLSNGLNSGVSDGYIWHPAGLSDAEWAYHEITREPFEYPAGKDVCRSDLVAGIDAAAKRMVAALGDSEGQS